MNMGHNAAAAPIFVNPLNDRQRSSLTDTLLNGGFERHEPA